MLERSRATEVAIETSRTTRTPIARIVVFRKLR
jgi:hypothetical protein